MASIDQIDFVLRQGLIKDLNDLPYGRVILQDPRSSIRNVAFQPVAGEIFENLLDMIFGDPVLYNKLRSDLLTYQRPAESILSLDAVQALTEKSRSTNIPFNTLTEVFRRGYNDNKKPRWLTREQFGFNRVNSYINNGRAADLDSDLPRNREEGSDQLVAIYKRDTPGQSPASDTLRTIKKVIKEKKND